MNVLIISTTEDTGRFELSQFDEVFSFQYQTPADWAAELPFDSCLISKWAVDLPRFHDLLTKLKLSSKAFGGTIAVEDAYSNIEHPITT